MRKYLMGAAALAAMLSAPGLASADSGNVGVSLGNIEFDAGGDVDYWAINGAYTHDMSNGWVLQFDGDHQSFDASPDIGFAYGAAALGVRNDTYAVYGWVGLNDAFVSATQLGIGGQWYVGNVTLNGSLGYATSDDAFDSTDLHVDGTWFFMPDFGVGAEYTTTNVDFSLGGDIDVETLGLNGVWRFTGSPFQVNLGYLSSETDAGDATQWRLGFSYNFGTSSAQEQSTDGASWNGAGITARETLTGIF